MRLAWEKLDDPSNDRHWRRFEVDFGFRHSIHPTNWPGIAEPAGSITYDLTATHQAWDDDRAAWERAERTLERWALESFARAGDREILVLSLNHDGYLVRNVAVGSEWDDTWPALVSAVGEYTVVSSTDFARGVFAHPWEKTLCVFGDRLLKYATLDRPGDLVERRRN
jgi:hypothetical protein